MWIFVLGTDSQTHKIRKTKYKNKDFFFYNVASLIVVDDFLRLVYNTAENATSNGNRLRFFVTPLFESFFQM